MKIIAACIVIAASLGLAGCGEMTPAAEVPPGPAEAPPPPPPPQLVGTDPRSAPLVHGEVEAEGLAAYGYVVFAKRPDRSDDEAYGRAVNLCRGYQQLPLAGGVGSGKPFLTYWPLRAADVQVHDDCARLVDAYDDERVDWLRSCLRIEGRRGPVLMAQAVPYQPGQAGVPRVVLDLSAVSTPDLLTAIDAWKRFTVKAPLHPIFYNAREAFESFIAEFSFGGARLRRLSTGCE
jgi:hypothetical protein